MKYLKENAGLSFMESSLKQYTAYEYLDTYESLYAAETSDSARANFTTFLNELFRLTQDGKN